ncbi:MAG: multicopper oxidase family protein [Chthoniobacterales bacterium]
MPRLSFLVATALLAFAPGGFAGDAFQQKAPTPPFPQPFSVPLPIIPTLQPTSTDATTDYYDVTMQVGQKEIIPGALTTIWGYNGMMPGPTIVARSGRRTVVRQVNNLQESVSVHLHGGHTPPSSDGNPTDLIGPGGLKTYDYPNNAQAATLWYHDHAIDVTGRHIYMGLSGFYLLHDEQEESLNLPKDKNDVALMLQDRILDYRGALIYPLTDATVLTGVYGDRLLVNGAIQPYYQVARRKMRFRILNASNTRTYRLALSNGNPLTQIATDGGLLSAPVSRPAITVSSGERVEVVIDFANYPIGTSLILKNLDTTGSPVIADIMRFDVVRDELDASTLPKTLRPMTRISEKAATVNRTYALQRGTQNGRIVWLVNGQLYDPARVDAMPQLNTTEIWTFQNSSSETHPMHIHDIQWQILDVNGVAPDPGDAGWKDTFFVPGQGGTVRVIGTFTDNLGGYVAHCHKVEHEDHAMMFTFAVQP